MIFQKIWKFLKIRISQKNIKILIFSKEKEVFEMEMHSTSSPCGNLVDSFPHDCHTEAIAELARLGPRKVMN